jgi:hypothetical protein
MDERNLVTASRETGTREDGTAAFLRLPAECADRRTITTGNREERV